MFYAHYRECSPFVILVITSVMDANVSMNTK